LIQRSTLAITLIQGESGLPKQLIVEIGNDIAKVRAVRDVEHIGSKLEVELVVEVDVSAQGKTELLRAKASRNVPRGVSLRSA